MSNTEENTFRTLWFIQLLCSNEGPGARDCRFVLYACFSMYFSFILIVSSPTGDRSVGKTTLLNAFALKSYDATYFPNVFDSYVFVGSFNGSPFTTIIWDVMGGQNVDALWTLKFNSAHIIVICFAINNVSSFEDVTKRWIPEAQLHAPDAPIILVGTKADLRGDDGDGNCVTQQMGQRLQDENKVFKYLECSAKEDSYSLKSVLGEALIVASMCENTAVRSFPRSGK